MLVVMLDKITQLEAVQDTMEAVAEVKIITVAADHHSIRTCSATQDTRAPMDIQHQTIHPLSMSQVLEMAETAMVAMVQLRQVVGLVSSCFLFKT
jgi:hypothetical protein